MREELVDVVDEDDQFVRKATRKEAKEKSLRYRLARVIIINSEGKILVQKRAKGKELYPSWWDIGVTETLRSGESYEAAAMRGLMEELGIIGVSNIQLIRAFLFKVVYTSKYNNVICKVYKHEYDDKLTLQPDEVDEVRFLTATEIEQFMQREQFTPGGKITFQKYLEHKAQ